MPMALCTRAGSRTNHPGNGTTGQTPEPATGWREIGGKWYYFDEYGVMAVNTKVDGYEIGPDGARKED